MPVVKLYPKSPTELYANWTLVKCKNKSPIIEQKIQWKKKKKHYHIEKSLLPNVTECTIYSKSESMFASLFIYFDSF